MMQCTSKSMTKPSRRTHIFFGDVQADKVLGIRTLRYRKSRVGHAFLLTHLSINNACCLLAFIMSKLVASFETRKKKRN